MSQASTRLQQKRVSKFFDNKNSQQNYEKIIKGIIGNVYNNDYRANSLGSGAYICVSDAIFIS